MSDDPRLFRAPFHVRAYEVGPNGRASLLTLCDYLQEAAGLHAAALGLERVPLGDSGDRAGVWVLRRLRVEAARLPAWGERVTVRTWPSRHDGLRAHREFEVLDADDARIATATSRWFVIDPARRRPARLPGLLAEVELSDRPVPLPENSPPPVLNDGVAHATFTVRRSELDQNDHANHVRFIEWAAETVPAAYAKAHALTGIDLLIEHEAHVGDPIAATAAPTGDGWAHRLDRDDTRLARLTTRWAPIAWGPPTDG